MTEGFMSVDDLLSQQQTQRLMGGIEPATEDPTYVHVYPWRYEIGCDCHSVLTIPKRWIKQVQPTGQMCGCPGRILRVVLIEFEPELTFSADELSKLFGAAGGHMPAQPVQSERASFMQASTMIAAQPAVSPGAEPPEFQMQPNAARSPGSVYVVCGNCSGWKPINTQCCYGGAGTCPPGTRCCFHTNYGYGCCLPHGPWYGPMQC